MDYVVQEGDTLSEILYDNTGDGTYDTYVDVAKKNNIENPDLIRPGDVIHIDTDGNSGNSSSSNSTYEKNKAAAEAQGQGQSSSTSASSPSQSNSQQSNGTSSQSDSQQSNGTSSQSDSQSSNSTYEKNKAGAEASAKAAGQTHNAPKESAPSKPKVSVDQNAASNAQAARQSGISQSVAATKASAPSYKRSDGSYKFTSSLEDEDTIQMDCQEASNYINGTMSDDLYEICSCLEVLNLALADLQDRHHSTSSTNVDQDYLDFEELSKELCDFTVECDRVLSDINNYIEMNSKILNS